MILRAFQETDLDQIKIIHEKFYKEEFDLPDFTKNFICAFTVIQNDKVIMAGGVRTFAVVVLVTDKEASLRKRRDAFLQVLDAPEYFLGGGAMGPGGQYSYGQNMPTAPMQGGYQFQNNPILKGGPAGMQPMGGLPSATGGDISGGGAPAMQTNTGGGGGGFSGLQGDH